MSSKITAKKGDYFTIPMVDGRNAICQIVWMGEESPGKKFKKVFAFCVLSVGVDKSVPKENEYLSFEDHKGMFKVIFTAVDKLLSGDWPILNAGDLKDPNMITFEFNMAGTLYRSGQPIRVLPIDEYKNHIAIAVSGYALVNDFLNQH